MRSFKLGIAAGAVMVAAALPATAPAQPQAIVPPGNSAANQYTETAPSAGGEQLPPGGSSPGGNSPAGHSPSPTQALGAPTANRLEELGPAGRATAALAAAGAPARGRRQSGGGPGSRARPTSPPPADPAGSSGLGQVLGQATGLSPASQSSLPLLLAIVATVVWSFAYRRRRRGRVA
jgi:hypothetical protein